MKHPFLKGERLNALHYIALILALFGVIVAIVTDMRFWFALWCMVPITAGLIVDLITYWEKRDEAKRGTANPHPPAHNSDP